MKVWFYFLVFNFCISCFASSRDWIDTQIQEDLAYLKEHPISASELEKWFDQISEEGRQAVYFEIRNNWFTLKKKTKRSDEWRNPVIGRYFLSLSKKYSLPNTAFVLFTDDGTYESTSFPAFAFAKDVRANNVALLPDFEMMWEIIDEKRSWLDISEEYAAQSPWHSKKKCAFFRGVSTGIYDPAFTDFNNDRVKVVLFSSQYPDLVDAAFSAIFQPTIHSLMMLINKPLDSASTLHHYQYKYLLDIDGNSCTYSRCRWILLSNSTLVKVISSNKQWYYQALQPWVNFVPVKQDLSDLAENLHFLQNNDSIAQAIAEEGKKLGKEIFSEAIVDLYVARMLHAYAKYIK